MLVGSLEGGAYRITEHRDGLIPPMTEVGQRVIVSTTCVPSNDARLFGLSIIEIPYITINCAAPGSPDHILARDTPSFENPICRMPQ
ncbi:MAG: hypothetical protein Q8Q09_15955 [Deltaproteobacteria bacterium]|nr:hypothetical protein [Deltaproteobacteria bacterium]